MMNRAQLLQGGPFHFSSQKRKNLGDHVIAAMSGAISRVFHTARTLGSPMWEKNNSRISCFATVRSFINFLCLPYTLFISTDV
jgi:hypothetical protein